MKKKILHLSYEIFIALVISFIFYAPFILLSDFLFDLKPRNPNAFIGGTVSLVAIFLSGLFILNIYLLAKDLYQPYRRSSLFTSFIFSFLLVPAYFNRYQGDFLNLNSLSLGLTEKMLLNLLFFEFIIITVIFIWVHYRGKTMSKNLKKKD